MREALYQRQSDNRNAGHYKTALGELYQEILRFQVTCYCYYNGNTTRRFGSDVVKKYNWDEMIGKIDAKESQMVAISKLWRDEQYEKECDEVEERHRETINDLTVIGANISDLQKAIDDANKRDDRKEFLGWLCDVDPSQLYNSACRKHEDGTSEWLTLRNERFKDWRDSQHSFLWLHGKGVSYSKFHYLIQS